MGLDELLPKQGRLFTEDKPHLIFCPPKVLPLKSVTYEKLEKMQKAATERIESRAEKRTPSDTSEK